MLENEGITTLTQAIRVGTVYMVNFEQKHGKNQKGIIKTPREINKAEGMSENEEESTLYAGTRKNLNSEPWYPHKT